MCICTWWFQGNNCKNYPRNLDRDRPLTFKGGLCFYLRDRTLLSLSRFLLIFYIDAIREKRSPGYGYRRGKKHYWARGRLPHQSLRKVWLYQRCNHSSKLNVLNEQHDVMVICVWREPPTCWSHWQTLSHNVCRVHLAVCQNRIRLCSVDKHW